MSKTKPFGNRTGLPEREPGRAPDIVAQAKIHAGEPSVIRLTIAATLIAQARAEWRGADEEILQAIGFRSTGAYWKAATAVPMQVSSFVHLLDTHLLDPTEGLGPFGKTTVVAHHLCRAFRIAKDAGEDFLFDGRSGTMVRPREAARWLLAVPLFSEFVPVGLRSFLSASGVQSAPALTPPAHSNSLQSDTTPAPQKRGPKPEKEERVKAAMRVVNRTELKNMKIEEMAAAFQTSPSTARRIARDDLRRRRDGLESGTRG